jgi:5,10-methylenetetrahydrofolate reductase
MMRFSYEIITPKNDADLPALVRQHEVLLSLEPEFISLTCHNNVLQQLFLIDLLQQQTDTKLVPHVPVGNKTEALLKECLIDYMERGIDTVLLIHGDGAGDMSVCDALHYIHKTFPERWTTFVSYNYLAPEQAFAEKVSAGATQAISQICFSAEVLPAKELQVCPILPGILLIDDFSAVQTFLQSVKITAPDVLQQANEDETLAFYKNLLFALHEHGYQQPHFFSLNNFSLLSELVYA